MCYLFHQTNIFVEFFDTLEKNPDIKVVGDSLDTEIDMWQEKSLDIFYFLCWSVQSMKFQVKVEYGKDKFVKFYVEADVVDGIGDFVNLNEDDTDKKERERFKKCHHLQGILNISLTLAH